MVGKEVPLARVQGAVWSMLYTDDTGIVSKSEGGLAKRMAVIVTVFEVAGLTVLYREIGRRRCCYEHGIKHPLFHHS